MELLKFLIADDEENIRNGLKCIIDWEKCGYKFCGEASNGKDALNQIIDLQPDLVILDIKMPGLTGIEVMTQVNNYFQQKKMECPSFLILSGFSDFDYAKNAVNLGAKGYLLKPVDEDELEKKVIEQANKIKERRKIIKNNEVSIAQETKNYLSKIIKTGMIDETNIPEENAFFACSSESLYMAVVFFMDYMNQNKISSLQQKLEVYFSFFIKEFLVEGNRISLFLKTSNSNAVYNCIERAAKLNPEKTFITCGENLLGLNGLLESYNDALTAEKYLFYNTDTPFIDLNNIEISSKKVTENELNQIVDNLVFCVETYDKEKAENTTEQLKDLLYNFNESETDVKKNFIFCLMELHNRITQKYPEREINDGQTFDVVSEVLCRKTFEDVLLYFKEVVDNFIENFNFNTSDSIIVKVIAYININYASDLKLETLGEMFNCNSAYLGKKFKKYTGVQFNTYLDNIRIEEAKKKLSTTDLKIYQISKLVGYSNTDYFFMKFKKNTGLTPKEFKKGLGDGNDS